MRSDCGFKFPKIHTLYMRDTEKEGYPIIEGSYAKPAFELIDQYEVTEKIDGTNIRVIYNPRMVDDDQKVRFAGRTDNAQIPTALTKRLQELFSLEKLSAHFGDKEAIIFGEGYGRDIQNGGKYRDNQDFILFGAYIDEWWLEREALEALSQALDLDIVPFLGVMNKAEIVALVKQKPLSSIAKEARPIEGVVCRARPMVLFREGHPVTFKLKLKDYPGGEN